MKKVGIVALLLLVGSLLAAQEQLCLVNAEIPYLAYCLKDLFVSSEIRQTHSDANNDVVIFSSNGRMSIRQRPDASLMDFKSITQADYGQIKRICTSDGFRRVTKDLRQAAKDKIQSLLYVIRNADQYTQEQLAGIQGALADLYNHLTALQQTQALRALEPSDRLRMQAIVGANR
jgi:hypothetical protein